MPIDAALRDICLKSDSYKLTDGDDPHLLISPEMVLPARVPVHGHREAATLGSYGNIRQSIFKRAVGLCVTRHVDYGQ